jgi:hypothetical protein
MWEVQNEVFPLFTLYEDGSLSKPRGRITTMQAWLHITLTYTKIKTKSVGSDPKQRKETKFKMYCFLISFISLLGSRTAYPRLFSIHAFIIDMFVSLRVLLNFSSLPVCTYLYYTSFIFYASNVFCPVVARITDNVTNL